MRALIMSLFLVRTAAAQEVPVPLTVEAGVPLRLYLTQRLPMKIDTTAKAKLIEPVYVFDRIVIPAGSEVQGHVTALDKVGKLIRTKALLGGDFTPLHRARVEFTGVTLPNGQALALHTTSTAGFADPLHRAQTAKATQEGPESPGLQQQRSA